MKIILKNFFEDEYMIDIYDEQNEDIWEDLQNADISEFVDWLVNTSKYSDGKLSDEYAYVLEEEIPDNEYSFTYECLEELIDSFAHENSYVADFNKAKKSYMDFFERNALHDEYNMVDDYDEDKKSINSAEELDEINDSVGDTHKIDFKYDYKDRDYAFIYVDGELIEGKEGQTHAQILENYLIDNDREDEIPEDYKTDDGDIGGSRPSKKRVERLVGKEDADVAFGHVIDNVALVEIVNGVSEDTVAKTCMKELNIDKVYFVNHQNEVVKRLAKVVLYTKENV